MFLLLNAVSFQLSSRSRPGRLQTAVRRGTLLWLPRPESISTSGHALLRWLVIRSWIISLMVLPVRDTLRSRICFAAALILALTCTLPSAALLTGPKISLYLSVSRLSEVHSSAAFQFKGMISSPPIQLFWPKERKYLFCGPPLPRRKNSSVFLRYRLSRQ